ncbi:MAG: hypothetical protein SV375_15320, partial [Thermodesulfobacteriota bacterium]|nr:hypothetical protein [Thermodesulfobacteriota bacterium]
LTGSLACKWVRSSGWIHAYLEYSQDTWFPELKRKKSVDVSIISNYFQFNILSDQAMPQKMRETILSKLEGGNG